MITEPVMVITARPPRMSFDAFTKVLEAASVTADPMPSIRAKRLGSKLAVQPHECARKRIRAEGLEVFGLFPHADEMDRHVVAFGDRDQHASLGGAIEFGHHEAGYARGVAESLHLAERVLPDRGVKYENDIVRCRGVDLADGAHDLGEFVHQLRLVLQPASGVDQ